MSAPDSPSGHESTKASFRHAAPYRGIAAASVGLGFFSLLVFWWFPFGLCLASVGLILGVGSAIVGIKGGLRGENLALLGATICAISIGTTLAVYRGVGILLGTDS
jgi:hypothetical protein